MVADTVRSHAHSNYFSAAYHCYNIPFNVIAACLLAVMTSSGIGYCLAICKCTQHFMNFILLFEIKHSTEIDAHLICNAMHILLLYTQLQTSGIA